MKTSIIYEDEDIMVVQKPGGLATQSARTGQADVVSELKCYLAAKNKNQTKAAGKKEVYLGVLHRLDQPVEGLLVFAKNKAAAAALTRQLSEGTLNKQYYAVLCGEGRYAGDDLSARPDWRMEENLSALEKGGELVDYLIKEDSKARVVTGQQDKYPRAKKAVLQYKILQEISTPEPLALADIHIDTGRFHQIRAQMSHAGLPLLGDVKYGDARVQELGRRLEVRNVALCAYSLHFEHPITGKTLSFQIKPTGRAFSYFVTIHNRADL